MSGIAGLRGTGNWGTDERPKDFREGILWINPNGDSPIFALTGKAGKVIKKDPEFSWWSEAQNNVRLQVNGALASTDTVVTVDSPDPTGTTMGTAWGTATHLKAGDMLLVEPATDAATFDHEVVLVTAVLSDTQFQISRGFGGTTPAAIGNDLWLLLIGSAYAEGTAAPQAVTRNPTKFYNYMQIFKDSYELTGTADKTASRTGDPWSNDKKRKMFDHARGIEWSILFGRKSETTGANGKPLRTMGGIREFIPSSRVTVGVANVNAMMDALAPMFDFKMSGTDDTRIAFAGNTALLQIAKMIQNATNASIDIKENFRAWGMKFQEWTTPLGTVLVKSHPLLSAHPLYKSSMFVLDFNAIKYAHLSGRDTKSHDDVQAKDEDVRRGYVQTECSLEVHGGGLTLGYIGAILQA